jgi:hypothetical protein
MLSVLETCIATRLYKSPTAVPTAVGSFWLFTILTLRAKDSAGSTNTSVIGIDGVEVNKEDMAVWYLIRTRVQHVAAS